VKELVREDAPYLEVRDFDGNEAEQLDEAVVARQKLGYVDGDVDGDQGSDGRGYGPAGPMVRPPGDAKRGREP
jgi:hypothetical protein